MSSVAGLLVPNNFNITSSGGDIAEGLFSDNGNNVINTTNAANPIANQALVATGPNAATWQTVALPDNALTLTNKNLADSSNVVASEFLWVNGKTQTINTGQQPAPTAGQVLTCTLAPTIFPGEARWTTPAPVPVNATQGGFKSFGAVAPGTVLTAVPTTGEVFDSVVIVGHIIVSNEVVTECKAYRVSATFIKVAGVLTQIGSSIADDLGGTLAEAAPVWAVNPGVPETIQLQKVGALNTRWGGSWTYTTNGVTV